MIKLNDAVRLSLYHQQSCPYCEITRRAIDQSSLTVELRDILLEPHYFNELIDQGGKVQVPCLRIDTDDGRSLWLYESSEIIQAIQGHEN